MKQLRITTTKPYSLILGAFDEDVVERKPIVDIKNNGELITPTLKGRNAYLDGKLEELAKFDIPLFIDGDMGQLDMDTSKQNILFLMPKKNYKCKAILQSSGSYYITLAKK
jgi:hypothetical protein